MKTNIEYRNEGEHVVAEIGVDLTDEQEHIAQMIAASKGFTTDNLRAAVVALRDSIGGLHGLATVPVEEARLLADFVDAFLTTGGPERYYVPNELQPGTALPGEREWTPGKVKGWNACRAAILKHARG